MELVDADRLLWLLAKVNLTTHQGAGLKLLNHRWDFYSYHSVRDLEQDKRVFSYLTDQGFGADKISELSVMLVSHVQYARWNSYDVSLELIAYVLSLGVDINAQINEDHTLLHVIAGNYCYECVSESILPWLLANNADPMIKNKHDSYFIEMIGWVPGLKENKAKIKHIVEWLKYYPDDFLPKNAEALFLWALEAEVFEFASLLLDRGLKPPRLTHLEQERNAICLKFLTTLSTEAQTWLFREERCKCMINEDAVGQIFYHVITQFNLYHFGLMLLSHYSERILASREGKDILHAIANQGHSDHHDGLLALVEQCYELGLMLDSSDDKGRSLKSLLKDKLQSATNPYSAYAVSRVFFNKTKEPFLGYKELDGYIATGYKNNECDPCVDEIITIYPKEIIDSLALKNAIDAVNLERVQMLIRDFDTCPPYIDAYEQEHLIRWPVFLYALKRLDVNPDQPIFSSQQEANDWRKSHTEQTEGIFLCLISKNYHKMLPHASYLNAISRLIKFGSSNAVIKMLECLPESMVNTQLDNGSSYEGVNLIQAASRVGQVDVVSALLSRKASVDAMSLVKSDWQSDMTPLVYACGSGHLEVVKVLLAHKADTNGRQDGAYFSDRPLYKAINSYDKKNRDSLVGLLLNQDATILVNDMISFQSAKPPFSQPLQEQFYDAATADAKVEQNWLTHAIERSYDPLVFRMLSDSDCPRFIEARNFEGQQAIHMAAKKGNVTIFQALLKAKASLDSVDFQGNTPLAYAVMNETLDTLSLPFCGRFDYREMHDFIRSCVSHEKEFKSSSSDYIMDLLRGYAYKLFSLFQTHKKVQVYIKRYRSKTSHQPIHDLCQFQLPPADSNWDPQVWADFVQQDPTKWLPYLPWAAYVQRHLGSTPKSLAEVDKLSSNFGYIRQDEDIPLAQLFLTYKIPEIAFNRALVMNWPKSKDQMPSIHIDGVDCGNPGYYFKKLESTDMRGFVLGHLTYCCQSVGSEGEGPACHGLLSPFGGFYAVFKRPDKVKNKYEHLLRLLDDADDIEKFFASLSDKSQRRAFKGQAATWQQQHPDGDPFIYFRHKLESELEGGMVAQCWAWVSKQNELVFDSWEQVRRPEIADLCQPFLVAAAKVAMAQNGFKRVLLGVSGQTPQDLTLPQVSGSSLAVPKDYSGYRDSTNGQYMLGAIDAYEAKAGSRLPLSRLWKKTPDELMDRYSAETMKDALDHIRLDNEGIDVLKPLRIPKYSKDPVVISDYLKDLESSMCLRDDLERHGIVPLMFKRDYKTIPEQLDGDEYVVEGKQIHWCILALSVYKLAMLEEISVAVYLLNPLILSPCSLSQCDLPVTMINDDSVNQVYETGPWVVSTFNHFLKTKTWGASFTDESADDDSATHSASGP